MKQHNKAALTRHKSANEKKTIGNPSRITCCQNCQKRHYGCHVTCEQYIMQKAAMDEYRLNERRKNEETTDILKTMNPLRVRSKRIYR